MPRFYIPNPLEIGITVTLPEAVAHHINVLRLPLDTPVTLFNGSGGEFIATIASLERKRVSVEVKTFSPREAELPYAITLAQALPESSKLDWIIEKAVELGAAGIQPLSAQRCVVRLAADRVEKKQAHWQAVIISAAEQSGRNRLPHLAPLTSLSDWLGQKDLHKRIILSPRGEASLSDWARHQPPQSVALLIGPEGGFTDAEESAACAQGALMLSMGARILRTETAGLAALAALNAIWGEM
ncbi:16S rRNA (uracil(1498)-N(3))-methyltransferase [Glaciimonas immobilis]|uniref:Ribosomal RNA small subunit methyltransferase E n=1 Tax=Glaciimonas immobilis TaxID=728004 RepID=A0A840RYU9_9BURK|nr:16S rRNA (uracil(1498)-N(3))-methyltransferase [Glaciimonas immobilis]KAF3998465.1 16S rRNA (uracil(1498)-N(3))-methyltransferase [Glaciimonas immobilis]MBB5202036.1 16S rRNA (uracil1498-N3)-methyltransferase [Glaciimonas immobilis]